MKKRITKKELAKAKAQVRRELRAARKATKSVGPPSKFKPGQSGNPAGPPTKELTAKQYELIIALKRKYISESTIAHAVNMSAPTFIAYKKTHPELMEALAYGHGLAQDRTMGRLARQGIKNFIANIFLLKAQHGFSEGGEQAGPAPQVIINIPGAARVENIVEGMRIPEPSGDAPGVMRTLPHTETEARETAPMPEAREHQPPQREQSPQERAMADARADKMGIRIDRNSFDSEAAWNRFNKSR